MARSVPCVALSFVTTVSPGGTIRSAARHRWEPAMRSWIPPWWRCIVVCVHDSSFCSVGLPNAVPKPQRIVDAGYLHFLRGFPCHICRLTAGKPVPSGSEACHVQSVGAGGDDTQALPMCHEHHVEQHTMGIVSFQKRHKVNLKRGAATYYRAYVREGKPAW